MRPTAAAAVRLALALAISCPAVSSAQRREPLPIEQLRAFTEVYGALRMNYVDSIDHDVLIRHAIEGLLKVDPHAAYYDAEAFKELQYGGAGLGGLGIEVTQRQGVLRVVSAIEDAPASHAGLRPDDALLKIDGVDVQEKSLADAVKLMRGKAGTEVKLTLQRHGEPQPREMTLVRQVIRVRSVKSRMIDPGVAYVRVSQFQERTPEILAREIATLFAKAPPRILVLDLRSNPGGLLLSGVAIAALFLPESALVLKMNGRAPEDKREFRASPQDYLRKGQADPRPLLPARAQSVPMAVLIDRGTAAGSEFVAAALREHKRAILVGAQTFGRGTVQTIMPLGNNTAVKFTTARYESPSGEPFEGVGVRPDLELTEQIGVADFGGEADPVLRAAIDRLLR